MKGLLTYGVDCPIINKQLPAGTMREDDTMIDLSNQSVLERYLQEKNLVRGGDGHSVHYCNGGVSGIVVFVNRPQKKPLIVKQALAQLKVAETWECDPSRIKVEYDSNQIYHELMPENAPEVYFYDEKNYIYGREAVPEGCSMWKEDLMSGFIDFEVARKSIETLNVVHSKCAGNSKIAERFSDKSIFYNLRINPYIEFSVQRHPELKSDADRVIREMTQTSITLVHGDYSPKNIMVQDRAISVLDYEVACCGHPAFDLAFFFNHMILKSVKFPQFSDTFLNLLQYMYRIYFSNVTFMDKDELEDCTVRTLALLMIARVDGKSPVEYLVGDEKKQEQVRQIAFQILKEKTGKIPDVIQIAKQHAPRG